MKEILETEAAYIAAFVDGEGHIDVQRIRNQKGTQSETYAIRFEVANTKINVLTWMRDLTWLGVIEPNSVTREGHRQGWKWRLVTDETLQLLPFIMPYLRLKIRQAELVLEFAELPTFRGIEVPEDIKITRQVIWEEMRALNRRGPI